MTHKEFCYWLDGYLNADPYADAKVKAKLDPVLKTAVPKDEPIDWDAFDKGRKAYGKIVNSPEFRKEIAEAHEKTKTAKGNPELRNEAIVLLRPMFKKIGNNEFILHTEAKLFDNLMRQYVENL